MLQKCRKMLRNEKGLTLIELLAVVVILGIIAAIAIPSIGNIIEKSREDAHKSTALQVMSAARLALANDEVQYISGTTNISGTSLKDEYLAKIGTEYESIVVETTSKKVTGITFTVKGEKYSYDPDGKPRPTT
jgi:type IV pilus assembly protein PilA